MFKNRKIAGRRGGDLAAWLLRASDMHALKPARDVDEAHFARF